MQSPALLTRRILALALIVFSGWMWTHHSDVIKLIVLQRPVLFGRYAQGHFGVLLLVTPILWALAAALWSRQPLRQALGIFAIGSVATLLAILIITYAAHFFTREARYIETALPPTKLQATHLAGSVRRRPPNQSYTLVYKDIPEQARSYPDLPPGYSDVAIQLTTDANGFRNPSVEKHYDIVAVGDSFIAGSNVSDQQAWVHLLAQSTGHSVYNLGVGGSGPPTYLSNFVYFGVDLTPRIALFMIYEGNDFKENVVLTEPLPPTLGQRINEHFEEALQSSPVTLGLRRASHDLFEKLGSTRPVPGYQEKLGFMPIKVSAGDSTSYYSFDPKRAFYLNYSKDEFSNSPEWQATANILQQIIQLCRSSNIQPVFVYAPSTPHVVLPLVKNSIPAEQLHYFMKLRSKKIPEPEILKQQLFANLDSEQNVFADFCAQQQLDCLTLTDALRAETAAGKQTYFSYDQHWTPTGNAIAASAIEQFLREKNYLN